MSNLQIFIYNAADYHIDSRNNFPLFTFLTNQDRVNFIRGLRSVPRDIEGNTEPYFVINNPQLLPADVRNLHTYPYYSPYIEDYVPNQNPIQREGVFRICDNIQYIQTYNNYIDDNTAAPTGFTCFLTLYANRIRIRNQI